MTISIFRSTALISATLASTLFTLPTQAVAADIGDSITVPQPQPEPSANSLAQGTSGPASLQPAQSANIPAIDNPQHANPTKGTRPINPADVNSDSGSGPYRLTDW